MDVNLPNPDSIASKELSGVWNANAAYWDAYVGEGHAWVEKLIWPATEQLIELRPGMNVLDVGCGNGLYARRLAERDVNVTAFDFSAEMIRFAQTRTSRHADRIDYHVVDATDESALLQLGEGKFDLAIAQMVLFDMHEIGPLLRSLSRLLRVHGKFVFSVMHPCFNSARFAQQAESEDVNGRLTKTFSLKLYEYLTARSYQTEALSGQPVLQSIFHRPLHILFDACFSAGFVIDGLSEPHFQTEKANSERQLTWSEGLCEFPPVLMVRLSPRSH